MQRNDNKFLRFDQEVHICELIDDWYFEWKNKINVPGQPDVNRLGVAKEQLKLMICGDK